MRFFINSWLSILFIFTLSLGKGIKAPDFALPDENGTIVKLSALKGNVVVLVFWATTCGVCQKELPEISFLVDEYKNKPVKFYAVVINSDNIQEIKKVKKKWGFDIPVLIGDYETVKNYRIIGTPIIYILRKDLTIGKIFYGHTPIKKLKKYIDKFLK